MEKLLKLESADTLASRSVANEIHSRLKGTRDPILLGELVDFYFETYSKRTRKILTTLGEAHSQDYFDKLCECLLSEKVLPVFKLLAHTLNSQHANWLYRIVDHTLFACILKQLEESDDVIVLAMGLLVVATILPMVPTYIGSYLQQLFSIFCNLATIRSTDRLGLTPHELVLHLDVSVYYFFLQLYALFPLNLFSFFKSYCQNSTRAQVNAFQEFVTPLFYQVQLHPGLVVDSCGDELSKVKWGAMEPSDIATLSLQFCIDKLLSPSCEDSTAEERGAVCKTRTLPMWTAVENQTIPSHRQPSIKIPPPPFENGVSTASPDAPPTRSLALKISKSDNALQKHPPTQSSDLLAADSTSYPALLTGPLNPAGLKTDEELCKFWSPSVSLGQISSHNGLLLSDSQRSRSQQLHLSSLHPLQPYSAISSPNSDSALSSMLQTPSLVPTGGHSSSNTTSSVPHIFTFKNYSPTASVDGESLFSRQIMSQSAVHTPSLLEESLNSRQQFDPLLTQSVCVGSVAARSKTPYRSGKKGSFKNRLGSFFGSIFKKEMELEKDGLDTADTEDFVEVFINSHHGHGEEMGTASPSDDVKKSENPEKKEAGEMGVACARDINQTHSSSSVQNSGEVVTSGHSDSPVDNHRGSGFDGVGQLMELDISTLPFSRRSSRSESETSHSSSSNNRDDNDSPNTAGTGRFNECQRSPHQYNFVGASTGCPGAAAAAIWMSSSYPRTRCSHMGVGHAGRVHTSNSETIYHVQERLQELVEEHSTSPSYKSCDGGGLDVAEDEATPLVQQRVRHTSQAPLSPPPTAHSSLLPGLSAMFPGSGRITMRRVSVCSRKGGKGNVKVCSESSDGSETVIMESQDQLHDQTAHPLPTNPSPLVLLDQFVTCGEVLHRGGLDTVLLTEQEGIDWNHFGGCPHSEEFRIMQSQVVLLHSQMLFERHQCLQHARRNRRLLSKARSATHVAQELMSLREQLHQQDALVSSLQEQLRKVSEKQEARQPSHQGMEGHIIRECVSLNENNARLQQELQHLGKKNSQLEESLWEANERIFALENERQQTKPHLQRASELQREMTGLTTQLHLLGELYQQQSDELVSLQFLSQREAEWKTRIAALTKEKEEGSRDALCLQQQLGACQYRLRELEEERKRWEAELEKMRMQREEEGGKACTRIKALEEKYGSMKVIGQQLESHVLELNGRDPFYRKKAHVRHRRNHSSTSLANTPSPSNMAMI